MKGFTIEYGGEKERYLIIDPVGTPYSSEIKKILSYFDAEVYVSPVIPPNLSRYKTCFLINLKDHEIKKIASDTSSKLLFIITGDRKRSEKNAEYLRKNNHSHSKIINAIRGLPDKDNMEKMLWFINEPGSEWMLTLDNYIYVEERNKIVRKKPLKKLFTKKRLILSLLVLIVLSHIAFLVPLAKSSYSLIEGLKHLENGDLQQAKNSIKKIDNSLPMASTLYSFARPTLLFFNIASYPDNLFELNESGRQAIITAAPFIDEATEFSRLLMNKESSNFDTELLKHKQKNILKKTDDLLRDLVILHEKLPEWNDELTTQKKKLSGIIEILEISRKILPNLDKLMASEGTKKYLLLFANNMELRPGGGFIGSFGLLNVEKFKIKSITIYDVYDADGQLNAHIPPPEPIRTYLNQPHWFLRDSAFSPDFHENYLSAVKFLDREMGFNGFDGGIIITTTAIQTILEGVGQIYIPEYRETINRDNFYLKAQLYAEKDFFPGSIQKKSFLSAVADSMSIQLEDNPSIGALKGIYKALNEKQIAVNFEDNELQNMADTLHWTGRLITPQCSVSDTPCANDFLFPFDANLGVNKANFFITQSTSLEVSLNKNGDAESRLKTIIRNNSPNNQFPGGVYKNYFQVLLPVSAEVRQIKINGNKETKYDESNELYKKIGVYVEIPHSAMYTIEIDYFQKEIINTGKNIYQLVLQKQIGSPDYDFELTFRVPDTIFILNKNFSALVKDNAILYNTSIKADKIFLIELMRNQQNY